MATTDETSAPTLHIPGGLAIAWKRECYRTTITSRTFGMQLALIQHTRGPSKISKLIGYLKNFSHTVFVLAQTRPKLVICMNLPPFLPIICAIYGIMYRRPVVMDFHSGALSSQKWRLFRPFYKWLARRSPFTLAHNRYDGVEIASWGACVVHLLSLPQSAFPGVTRERKAGRPQILFACSFAPDEPIEIALRAMRNSPEIDFIVSGNYSKAGLTEETVPGNVKLAGFMNYETYIRTMSESTAILTLSTRPHIMQMAVEEALTMGIPVIANESPTLEEAVGSGGILVPIEEDALAKAFDQAVNRFEQLSSQIAAAKVLIWSKNKDELILAKNKIAPLLIIQDPR